MSLSLAKSTWSAFEVFLSAQLNAITTQLLRAIDGTGGGTYNPSSVLAIGGSQGLRIEGTGGAARLKYNSRNVTRGMPNTARAINATWTLADDPHYWTHDDTTAADRLNWHLVGLPHGATLNTVTVRVTGTGTKPTTMPTARVYSVAHIGGTTSPLAAAVTDPSANDAAWQLDHTITTSSIGHVVDSTLYSYFVYVTGSNGSSGVTKVTGVEVTCAVTDQSEYNP
jgi:hypothetical protein